MNYLIIHIFTWYKNEINLSAFLRHLICLDYRLYLIAVFNPGLNLTIGIEEPSVFISSSPSTLKCINLKEELKA